jgi:hypothetical protein
MLSEHRPPRGQQAPRPDPHPEENAILTVAPEVANYVAGLKQKSPVGKPDARNGHVRFDERGRETTGCQ